MSDLPPIEPRDLRNRRDQEFNSNPDYPPPDYQEPAPAPRQRPPEQPRQTAYPPPDYREEDRHQQARPPRESYYPPSEPSREPTPRERQEPLRDERRMDDWERDPLYDERDYDRPVERSRNRGFDERPPRLDDVDAPDLRRRVGRRDDRDWGDDPRDRADQMRERYDPRGSILLTERQVEALGWGVMVILLGIGILLFFTGSSDFLTVGFPVLGGGVLLASSVYQSMKHWRVSFLTWMTAIGLVAFSVTRLIALADNQDTGFGTSLAFFFGISIIITGVIVLIRIFR